MWDSEFTSIKKDCLVAKLLASNGSIFLRYRGILIILGLYFVKKKCLTCSRKQVGNIGFTNHKLIKEDIPNQVPV